ncbi:MAG: hypothetical protein ACK4TP_13465 [Hyphomicrobium sp.]|jgi:hypothetical protein
MVIDHLFFLAIGAIGWGLSLASYRAMAQMAGWPLGVAQERLPALTSLLALASIAAGLALAIARGPLNGGIVILIFGVGLAVFWSGFLRVGAQSALLLAPTAALALLGAWVIAPFGII